jgi:spectrin beta
MSDELKRISLHRYSGLPQVTGRWSDLIALMDARKKRLTDAVDFHQFFTDADDVDNWMLDILKLVSSDDIGQDEGES